MKIADSAELLMQLYNDAKPFLREVISPDGKLLGQFILERKREVSA